MTIDHRFNPALEALLNDPLTWRMMQSDRVEMPALVGILAAARRRLAENERAGARPARSNGEGARD